MTLERGANSNIEFIYTTLWGSFRVGVHLLLVISQLLLPSVLPLMMLKDTNGGVIVLSSHKIEILKITSFGS